MSLKEKREEAGVSVQQIADYLGISRQQYYNYENDPGRIRVDVADRICKFLQCNINDIFLPL